MVNYKNDQPQVNYLYIKFGVEYITPSWDIASCESSINETPVYQICNGEKTIIKVYNTKK